MRDVMGFVATLANCRLSFLPHRRSNPPLAKSEICRFHLVPEAMADAYDAELYIRGKRTRALPASLPFFVDRSFRLRNEAAASMTNNNGEPRERKDGLRGKKMRDLDASAICVGLRLVNGTYLSRLTTSV